MSLKKKGNEMNGNENLVSNAYQIFVQEAPEHAQAWMIAVQSLGNACALDKKTESLAYLAVLSVKGLDSGVQFHVKVAKEAGASREEIISAILVGLPAAGNIVIRSLPVALQAYDS
ncbi:carboxymuconolactone decarboxylase family protein [Halomonas sp. SpR1]|uniref:carboxymuconolactone decarboxylase family protein n=1 Tax=Halomonas sp. SpR1 TaxID=3050462 RepID=UPI0027E5311F|nr:carboxymuconolactone decarboxylase family protein [Halomonas sp. SpR1]MDQ7734529.1 carboxymuconolactone decarboxylase family protein [Halomonas sp. SpR1]